MVNGSTSEARRDPTTIGLGARLSLLPADEKNGPRLVVEEFDPVEEIEP